MTATRGRSSSATAPAGPDSDHADRRLLRFTALSSDVTAHEVTQALIDGLRPDCDMPVNPDVFAFRRRGIYPQGIDVPSETALAWGPPEGPVHPIPGLALSQLRYHVSPAFPLSPSEIRRQAAALALAIDDDPRLAHQLGLRAAVPGGGVLSAPQVTSIRPTLRVGPGGYVDFSIIAEITQTCDIPMGQGTIRHRGGATLILDATGTPAMIVSQRIDNGHRLEAEADYLRKALSRGQMVIRHGRLVPEPGHRRAICAPRAG